MFSSETASFRRPPSDHETFLKRIKSVRIKRFKTVRKLLKITKILNGYLFVYPRASTRVLAYDKSKHFKNVFLTV
jgi:hypothetical protein